MKLVTLASMNNLKLKDKSAVIIGGSSGIGLASAGLFCAHGARVAIVGRNPATLEQARVKLAKRIRVNTLVPGCTKTPLTAPALSDPNVRAYVESVIPMRRWAEPEEIATAVLFLASNDSSYMTGAELAVDGGIAQV